MGIEERAAGSQGLMDLSQDVEGFSKADRKRLLNGLALELVRQQDLAGASQVWTRLAAQDPANIGLRLNLLDLALQREDKDDIEKNIKQIEEIEGNEGLLGRYCQVRYLIWQAQRAGDKDSRQAIQAKADDLLEDLVSRRGDWSVIPLASAELAEQELAQSDLKEDELRAKEEIIINFYLQAIKLGQRRAAVVAGRSNCFSRISKVIVRLSCSATFRWNRSSQGRSVKRRGLRLKIAIFRMHCRLPGRQFKPIQVNSKSESGWFRFYSPASSEPRRRRASRCG